MFNWANFTVYTCFTSAGECMQTENLHKCLFSSSFWIISILDQKRRFTFHAINFTIIKITFDRFLLFRFSSSPIPFHLQMFSILFFFMLFVLGIGSNIAMCTCIITILRDRFKALKAWQAAIGLSTVGFLFGLAYVTPVRIYVIIWSHYNLITGAFIECK